jgi:hypothetical protein
MARKINNYIKHMDNWGVIIQIEDVDWEDIEVLSEDKLIKPEN